MNRKIFCILLSCIVLCSLYYVFHGTNMSLTDFTSESTKDDSVFHNMANENSQSQEFEKTGFTWRDSKGDEFPVYMAHTGSCFIIRTSKSGDEYRAYLGEEVSKQIRKELSKSDTRRDRYCLKNRTLKQ